MLRSSCMPCFTATVWYKNAILCDPHQEPYVRKCAFDIGDYGLGYTANTLECGCDCLGAIHYFDGEQRVIAFLRMCVPAYTLPTRLSVAVIAWEPFTTLMVSSA